MSQSTVNRWNALPLERQKRSRTPSDKDDDSDDDISLVSRTPSPEPAHDNLNDYDGHHRGIEREIITVETKLKATNIGHRMLQKMGWKEGEGLGISGDGRPEPIPFKLKSDVTGLGKTTQDVRMIAMTVAQRRDLEMERQSRETEEQKKAREDKVAKKVAIKTEIVSTLRPFYCELCDKQYQSVTQYDEHIRSYAHTHKQRFKEMEAAQRPKDNSKAREKERKREEKELKRLAAASGVKLAPAPLTASVGAVGLAPVITPVSDGAKGGWGSAFKPAEPSSSGASGGFKKSGWATFASSSTSSEPAPVKSSGVSGWAPAETVPASKPGFSRGGWASATAPVLPANSPPAPPPEPSSLPPSPPEDGTSSVRVVKNPTFARAGFTNLDTTTSSPSSSFGPSSAPPPPSGPPPPPLPADLPPPPPPPAFDGPPPPPSDPAPPPPSSNTAYPSSYGGPRGHFSNSESSRSNIGNRNSYGDAGRGNRQHDAYDMEVDDREQAPSGLGRAAGGDGWQQGQERDSSSYDNRNRYGGPDAYGRGGRGYNSGVYGRDQGYRGGGGYRNGGGRR